MVVLLLAPYHDSIQLGQGFNSFLQKPCIVGAVQINESSLKTQASRAGGAANERGGRGSRFRILALLHLSSQALSKSQGIR